MVIKISKSRFTYKSSKGIPPVVYAKPDVMREIHIQDHYMLKVLS